MKKVLEREIDVLAINKRIIDILKENQINTICDICQNSRMELTSIGLTNNQINQIVVLLQLQGLDLKANHAKKNTILDKYIAKAK